MSKITNTAKNPRLDWLMGGNPNAIVDQEEQGQKELCHSSQLPKFDMYANDTRKEYKKHGIKVIPLGSSEDDLFYDVELHKGWKIKATDHSMWSKLLDEKDIEVASIFYKAAFYDREAHITFKEV